MSVAVAAAMGTGVAVAGTMVSVIVAGGSVGVVDAIGVDVALGWFVDVAGSAVAVPIASDGVAVTGSAGNSSS